MGTRSYGLRLKTVHFKHMLSLCMSQTHFTSKLVLYKKYRA